MLYFCCDTNRRHAVQNSSLNGIDYLEVLDDPALPVEQRQRTLFVHFIKDLAGPPLSAENFGIEGGERVRRIHVVNVTAGSEANILEVEVDKAGDFSIYTLRLVKDQDNPEPPDGIDPMLAEVDFSFKVECPSDFDCKEERVCPPEPVPKPEINYLAKDYASFRRLMLDRMALLMPQWTERNVADMGIALVELLAYVGDHLSYQQDAVATEAYLHTARRRVSVRRHARLVDYAMHDGRNARTWVQVEVDPNNVVFKKGIMVDGKEFVTQFLTSIPDQEAVIEPHSPAYRNALNAKPEVFEPREEAVALFKQHNEILFYTWSDKECCLPKGATHATLKDNYPNLKVHDILTFEEVIGPNTGHTGDADPTHRHPVRLTSVTNTADPLDSTLITEIEWAEEDALPFPLCISTQTDEEHGSQFIDDVSVARGNIILCDHGMTVHEEFEDAVPEPKLFQVPGTSGDPCAAHQRIPISARFRPKLQQSALTQAASYDATKPATAAMHWSMGDVDPEITLFEALDGSTVEWEPRRDFLNSSNVDKHFVVEIENDGTAYLRFGDDVRGRRPEPGTKFSATYRVGNGRSGNVGAESIAHVVTTQSGVTSVRNLLPAQGGTEPESMEKVRQRAPYAFRTQERAVTPEDYAEVTERLPGIQKAAATFRWTGSWHTVFLTGDREGGLNVDKDFQAATRLGVERYRMAGHDLEVDAPRYAPLEIEMQVCVKPDYFRSEVKKDLMEAFSNRDLPDGRRGVFHPDHFTFGQTVYLSPLYGAAQAVPGVDSVHITTFQRQGKPDVGPLGQGKLELDRLEIARLDNDRNFPERGVLRLELGGGK